MPSFDNSKKLSFGAPFLSRLFVNHGWMASKQHRIVFPMYHWFADTGLIEGKRLLAALQNSADLLMVTLICLNTSYINVPLIPSIGLFPWWISFDYYLRMTLG